MSPSRTLSTASRVLRQLSHDPRTVALLFIVPPVLLTIMKYVFQGEPQVYNSIAPMLLGIFPMIMMFLITSIVTLRERTTGTLDRLLTMPMTKLDFIFGYALAFSFLGLCQALISAGVMLGFLNVTVLGGVIPTLIAVVFASFLGTSLGLFLSAFATSEFQAIQFMPAILLPQLLLSGLLVPREAMPRLLTDISNYLPLSYAIDATKKVISNQGSIVNDSWIIALFLVLLLTAGSLTLKRQTK